MVGKNGGPLVGYWKLHMSSAELGGTWWWWGCENDYLRVCEGGAGAPCLGNTSESLRQSRARIPTILWTTEKGAKGSPTWLDFKAEILVRVCSSIVVN